MGVATLSGRRHAQMFWKCRDNIFTRQEDFVGSIVKEDEQITTPPNVSDAEIHLGNQEQDHKEYQALCFVRKSVILRTTE